MKIKENKGVKITLSALDAGDVFWYDEEYYLKTDRKDGVYVSAVCLSDGKMKTFAKETAVTFVNGYFQLD